MTEKMESTYWVWIYLSGDIGIIKQSCRKYCLRGLCVTVEPVLYIYTGGEEFGVRVGLINYPRFPDSKENIWNIALELATLLRDESYQSSALIMDNEKTLWISNRHE